MSARSKLLAVSALGVGVYAIVLAFYALVVKSEAAGLLKDLVALRVGVSTGIEARQFYKRHVRLLFEVSSPCDDENCSRIFKVKNRWLSGLRLEPPAEFNVSVSVKNGTVDSIGASLFRYMPIFPTLDASAGMVDEYTEFQSDSSVVRNSGWHGGHYGFPTPIGKPYLRVRLDSHATPEQRHNAFSFSFRCLIKPGWGCDLPCDYLPLAWRDWQVRVREVGFPGAFDEYYPKSARCKP